MYATLVAMLFKIFGVGALWVIRVPAVVFGGLTILFGSFIGLKIAGRKFALVLECLISFTPYFFMSSRMALDCNLMLGMTTVALYFTICFYKTRKNYTALLTGLFWGLSLYTYSLSWIPVAVFLLIFSILYLRKMLLEQRTVQEALGKLLFMWGPVILFAIPLVLFVIVNTFELEKMTFLGMTIPRVPCYRAGSLSFANVLANAGHVLPMLLTHDVYIFDAIPAYGTFYLCCLPFVVIGLIVGIVRSIICLVRKTASMRSILLVYVLILYLQLLFLDGPCIYRANGIYFGLAFLAVEGLFATIRFLYDLLGRITAIREKKGVRGTMVCAVALAIAVCCVIQACGFFGYYFGKYEEDYPIQWFFYDHMDEVIADVSGRDLTGRNVYFDDFNGTMYAYDALLRQVSPEVLNAQNPPLSDFAVCDAYHYALPEPAQISAYDIYVIFDHGGQGADADFAYWLEEMQFQKNTYGRMTVYYVY